MSEASKLENDELPNIVAVLSEQWGISKEAFVEMVEQYENRKNNRTSITLSLPTETVTFLGAILNADGITIDDTAMAKWIEYQVDTVYSEYETADRLS